MRPKTCLFCGAREERVAAMITSPNRAAICDKCITLSANLVKERLTPTGNMVLVNIGTLATNDQRFDGALGIIHNAALAIKDGRIHWAGPAERLPNGLEHYPRMDCGGRAVMPGLIDAHTHLLFAGERSEEFSLRAMKTPEAKTVLRGGGPPATARVTHALDEVEFNNLILQRLGRMLEMGTTTVEAAAGYSTNPQDEIRLLRRADFLQTKQPVDLVPTLDFPYLPMLDSERLRAIKLFDENILPDAARNKYSLRVPYGRRFPAYDEARELLEKARGLGMRIRVHREGQTTGGAHQLAVETGATAVDHCDLVEPRQVAVMGRLGISVTITPITSLARREPLPNLPELLASHVPLAIGTDCSPAPVLSESLPLAISLAVLELGLTPDQAIWSATMGSAISLGLNDRGWIGAKAVADLLILNAPHPSHLAYQPGTDLTWKVFKNGAVVVSQ